jgi:hypothetical protein
MPLPFFLAALFGKTAASVVAKGIAAKAAGAKAIVGHHGHHALTREVAGKVAEKSVDSIVDNAASRKEKKKAKRESQ